MDMKRKDTVVTLHKIRNNNESGKVSAHRQAGQPQTPAGSSDRQDVKATAEARTAAQVSKAPQDADAMSFVYEALDHAANASLARVTNGLSRAAVMGAWFDWATHIAAAPGKGLQLAEKATDKARRHARFAINCASATDKSAPCITPLRQDDRFSDDAW